MKVHILAENRVRRRGLLAEHGLSLWIDTGKKKILFDTGQTDVYMHNSKAMGIDIESAEYIVISHGHYDHAGGLEFFPELDSVKGIYIHPDAFLRKTADAGDSEPERDVGVPWEMKPWIRDRLVRNRETVEIESGIAVSGEIPRVTSFERVPADFRVEREGRLEHDLIIDEQVLIVEVDGGIAVFSGCSHPGIVNCLEYVRKTYPDSTIKLLVAGMHMDNISRSRLDSSIKHMLDMNIKKLVPLHCTGFNAMCEMKRVFGERCHICCTGDMVATD